MSQPAPISASRPRIGRFALVRKIGNGGQGTVYLAEDPVLERCVAIKLIHRDGVGGGLAPGLLPREARMAARLQHPNIVPIYEVGHFRGRPYLVFEFVQGRTLGAALKAEGALPARRALALMRPIVEAMAHAHAREVLHLDLGPGNVMIGAHDVPRIMDFGLAQLRDAVRDTTALPVGTLLYMAPEQLEERPPAAPVDVRALGLILFEALTARSAIAARSVSRAVREITEQDIDLSALDTAPDMAPIIELLAACLARDPAARHPDAGALLHALDAAIEARAGLQAALAPASSQATVQFLLRRMQRRKDFPALSRSLVEINRMTAHESKATAGQLATVVLRDFALTNKLLKLANSAFYGVVAGEVKSVSHAIALLGFERLRITANSLTLFCHITDRARSSGLREMLVRSFVAGLLARHLARALAMANAEEAFICGMFQTLGETLTMFYFAEEYADIEAMLERERCTRRAATRRVLGIDFATLGAAVAREWRFPEVIVTAIAGLPDESADGTGQASPPADARADRARADGAPPCVSDGERLRDVAVFADAVCEILGRGDTAAPADDFALLCACFEHSLHQDAGTVPRIAAGALDRFDDHAGILGINSHASRWYQAARRCVQIAQAAPAQPPLRPPETPRSD
jgi:serine/threonine protein kinase